MSARWVGCIAAGWGAAAPGAQIFRGEQSAEPKKDLHPPYLRSLEQRGEGHTGTRSVSNAKGKAVSPDHSLPGLAANDCACPSDLEPAGSHQVGLLHGGPCPHLPTPPRVRTPWQGGQRGAVVGPELHSVFPHQGTTVPFPTRFGDSESWYPQSLRGEGGGGHCGVWGSRTPSAAPLPALRDSLWPAGGSRLPASRNRTSCHQVGCGGAAGFLAGT